MPASPKPEWTLDAAVVDEEARLLSALSPAERRRLGCYLTPWPVAELMARRVAGVLARGGHVIDPAAGTGRLLCAALAALPSEARRGALDRLHGVERQPALAALANRALRAQAGDDSTGGRCMAGDALLLLAPDRRREALGRRDFDAVLANPPYVREKHHARIFSALAASEPAWADRLRPRQDLQQLFLALALDWLAPGGELVFLVNPYWLQSDSGEGLRRELEARAELLAVVDFGPVGLFPEAKGQHHLLVHARARHPARPGEPAASPAATCRWVRVTRTGRRGLAELCTAIGRALDGGDAEGGLVVGTERLRVSGPRRRWYLAGERDEALSRLERGGVPLGECFQTHQGVVSGADRVTARNQGALDVPVPLGAGIFVLSLAELAELAPSPADWRVLRRVYRARHVRPADVAPPDEVLIYAWRGVDLAAHPVVWSHLERFRPLLARRRECRLGLVPWYELHWPRSPDLFERPRLVTPRRSTEPRFALAPAGTCEQSDIALITDSADDVERLRALLVVLHSQPVGDWCRHRGKQKGAVREFFGRPLEEIPLPRAVREDAEAFRALARWATPEGLAEGARRAAHLYAGWGRE